MSDFGRDFGAPDSGRTAEGTGNSPSDYSWQREEEVVVFETVRDPEQQPLDDETHTEQDDADDGTIEEVYPGEDERTVDDTVAETMENDSRVDDGSVGGGHDAYSTASSHPSQAEEEVAHLELQRLRDMVYLGPTACRSNMRVNDAEGRLVAAVCGGPLGSCSRPRHNLRSPDQRAPEGYYVSIVGGRRGYVDGRRPEHGVPLRTHDYEERVRTLEREYAEEIRQLSQLMAGRMELPRTVPGPPTGARPSEYPRGTPESYYTAREEPRPPTVTFGGVHSRPPAPPTRQVQTQHATPRTHNRQPFPPVGTTEWYGVLKDEVPWNVFNTFDKARTAIFGEPDTRLADQTFPDEAAANRWLMDGLRNRTRRPPPQPKAIPPTARPGRGSAVARASAGTVEAFWDDKEDVQGYYQIVKADGRRAIVITGEEITAALNEGGVCIGRLRDFESANLWIAQGTQVGGDPTQARRPDLSRSAPPVDLTRAVDLSESLGYAGRDPSTGDASIHNLDVTKIQEFQTKLVPKGMYPQDREYLIGLACDPTAVPRKSGGWRTQGQGQELLGQIVTTMSDTFNHASDLLYAKQGSGSQRYALSSENGALEYALRSKDNLEDLCDDFAEAWERELENQETLMRGHLSSAKYGDGFIDEWLYSGLLPSIVRRLGDYHQRFLSRLVTVANKNCNFPWETNPARGMLYEYLEKIKNWRANCGSKSNFIAQVYILYRNGYKSGFRESAESTKALLAFVHANMARMDKGSGGKGGSTNTGGNGKAAAASCSHCGKSKTVCPGNGNCPLADVPGGKCRRLMRPLNGKTAKKVYQLFQSYQDSEPDEDANELLKRALAEAKPEAS